MPLNKRYLAKNTIVTPKASHHILHSPGMWKENHFSLYSSPITNHGGDLCNKCKHVSTFLISINKVFSNFVMLLKWQSFIRWFRQILLLSIYASCILDYLLKLIIKLMIWNFDFLLNLAKLGHFFYEKSIV